MTWWEAIILGLVEGITEYLPVSSTGHLLVVQDLLGIGTEDADAWHAANAYAICIQAGAIVAVLGLYWQRVKQGVRGMFGTVGIGKGDDAGRRLFINLVVAFIPAAVVGVLQDKAFDNWIENNLFNAWTIVVAWAVGGFAIIAVAFWKRGKSGDEHAGKDLDQLTTSMAFTIGLIQCIAMMPGTSRSLVTIVGGVLVGMHIAAAVEFSFLLGVVTLLAATVYKAREAGPLMIDEYGWQPMIIGSVAAWLSAVVAIKWMVSYLKKNGMAIFGYYRIAIAILVAALILAGTIDANTPDKRDTTEATAPTKPSASLADPPAPAPLAHRSASSAG